MLYKLLQFFQQDLSLLNVFRYITFRTILATLTSMCICLFLGGWVIRVLREKQVGEIIREEGPSSHFSKKGTPTMGGCLILPAVLISILLWADPVNLYVWLAW